MYEVYNAKLNPNFCKKVNTPKEELPFLHLLTCSLVSNITQDRPIMDYDKFEKEILSQLLLGKKVLQQKDIMSYLHDVKDLPASPALLVPNIISSRAYYEMRFTTFFENFTSNDQKLLQLLTWNNFMKRSSEALKDISCIDFKPVVSHSEVKYKRCVCGESFKPRAYYRHRKKCKSHQLKKQQFNEQFINK